MAKKARRPIAATPRRKSTASTRTKAATPARKPAATSATRRKKAGTPARRSAPKSTTTRTRAIKTAKAGRKRAPTRGMTQTRKPRPEDLIQTPPSSLNLDRKGSAARTGRAEIQEDQENLGDMAALTGGDVDADAENAYFSGDEAPGGDNPTPDQDIVDDIGRALGVQYQDNEELRSGDKVAERDKHRWELDPASSEDYKDRR